MSSRSLSKLPIRDLLKALKQGNKASVKLGANVKGVRIHYKPSQAGRSSFIREELGHLVDTNPNIAWTSVIIPTIRASTKDPKIIEAVEKWKADFKASGEKDQQKIVVEFEDGASKIVRLRKGAPGKSILEEFLEAAGTSSPSPPSTSSSPDPSDPSSILSSTSIPASATTTASPAANALSLSQADSEASEAGSPRPSSLMSEQAKMTGSEEDVRADQDGGEEARRVVEIVEEAKERKD